jgi:hypothetical protein
MNNELSPSDSQLLLYQSPSGDIKPELFRICNPAKNLECDMKSKGVQYFVPEKEWKAKV